MSRSLRRQDLPFDAADRLWRRVRTLQYNPDVCWLWDGPVDDRGHGRIWLGKRRFYIGAHRLAYVLSNGPLEAGESVLQECENGRCCNPAHLVAQRVPDCAPRLLSASLVRDVKRLHELGRSQCSIADELALPASQVNRIVLGRAWRDT